MSARRGQSDPPPRPAAPHAARPPGPPAARAARLPAPPVQVRDELEGFISRSVFYGLVELALKQGQVSGSELMLTSGGQKFSLGLIE